MLSRDQQLRQLSSEHFDVAIVGGGIYGAMLALQSASCGLRCAVLEREDFGAATSFNSLRILHGGLRYLQSVDLLRSLQSIHERRWFLKNFPELVKPLPCLLPLYNHGLRRTSIMRAALLIDRLLSRNRNDGLRKHRRLPHGRIVGRSAAQDLYPGVPVEGLAGGALWYDAAVADSQRLIMELLHWATSQGALAVNYLAFESLQVEMGEVQSITARDLRSGEPVTVTARVIVNAAGPWCDEIARAHDPQYVGTTYPSLAWNILFNRDAVCDCALGLSSRDGDGRIYFMHPWKNKMLIGTGHAPLGQDSPATVHETQLIGMIEALNRAAPALKLSITDVDRVFSGVLPARQPGSVALTSRPVIHDHGRNGGPDGFVTVSGIKLGAARRVAEDAVRLILKRFFDARYDTVFAPSDRPEIQYGWEISAVDLGRDETSDRLLRELRGLLDDESVVHLDDLVVRRTTIWENPDAALRYAPVVADLFGWDEQRKAAEIDRLRDALASNLPASGPKGNFPV